MEKKVTWNVAETAAKAFVSGITAASMVWTWDYCAKLVEALKAAAKEAKKQ